MKSLRMTLLAVVILLPALALAQPATTSDAYKSFTQLKTLAGRVV